MVSAKLNYAIIAAGEGSRLAEEGVSVPKPLVELNGVPMLCRLLSLFVHLDANCICIIVNEQMTSVKQYLDDWKKMHPLVDLRVCVKSTPSSMHSMAELCSLIPEGRFVLTTVDTVFKEEEFEAYARTFAAGTAGDGLFAVTRFVDDEKPLWISVQESKLQDNDSSMLHDVERRIVEFSDTEGEFVSGGIYGLDTRTALPVLRECIASGQSRMRNYQRALLRSGLDIRAYEYSKIMDIDHKSDIEKAEAFLSNK